MYILKCPNKSGKVHLYLAEGYRDHRGKVVNRKIKSYGELSELQKIDPDILDKLKSEAKHLTELQKQGKLQSSTIYNERFIEKNITRKSNDGYDLVNYGYVFLEAIYNELDISQFLKNNIKDYSKAKYDFDNILKLLVFSRILSPSSKLETINNQDKYLKEFNVSLENVYRSLDVLCEMKLEIEKHLHLKITEKYNRDCTLVFYDVTNYYFETENTDELRKPGVSKENKTSPIVQMGLFIDNNGIPIAHELFSGNTHDSKTLIPSIEKIRKKFNLGKIIITADKGLNSGTNLAYIQNHNDGYIVSQKIRGASKEFINIILNEDGYRYNQDNTFKIKTFRRTRKVTYNDEIITLNENVVCFWSKDYDNREKHKREKLLERINNYIEQPSKYKASNSFGIKKYLKELHVDKETGEATKASVKLSFNKEKYDRDEVLDGYYALITNELELSAEEVIKKYRGLWKIEESFRVIKSDLTGRPVYVRNETRINGHFLICFISLIISRLLELKLQHKYSIAKIQESLNKANMMVMDKGFGKLYCKQKNNELFKEIEELYGVQSLENETYIENIKKYYKKLKVKI